MRSHKRGKNTGLSTQSGNGAETIVAASKLFHKRIDVYCEGGNILQFNQEETANGVLRIAYRLSAHTRSSNRRNHYDSVVHRINTSNLTHTENTGNPERTFCAPISAMETWQDNPAIDASQISLRSNNSNTTTGVPVILPDNTFKCASWNVRGCSTSEKRNQVDEVLINQQIKLAAIQETRMPNCTMTTENYIWYNVNDDNTRQREGGGTAIVVHKQLHDNNMFRKISSNSASYKCQVFGQTILFIATYVRPVSNEANGEFATLIKYTLNLPLDMQEKIVIQTILNNTTNILYIKIH